MTDLAGLSHQLSIWFLPVVTAITLHEAAHAWTADRLGDDTARRLGRVSFNPVRHVDPIGTFILPGLLLLLSSPVVLGWAKPVPVAFHRLHRPKRDMVWVALAGPMMNLTLAALAVVLLQPYVPLYLSDLDSAGVFLWIFQNLYNCVFVNVVLACFNMLPIPPLDGGRIVTGLLPRRLAWRFARIEVFGIAFILLFGIVLPLIVSEFGFDFNPLVSILWPVVETVYNAMLTLGGIRP